MGDVINLRLARKARARAEAAKQAAENRARHGRTKAERARDAAEAVRAERHLDQHRRAPAEPTAPERDEADAREDTGGSHDHDDDDDGADPEDGDDAGPEDGDDAEPRHAPLARIRHVLALLVSVLQATLGRVSAPLNTLGRAWARRSGAAWPRGSPTQRARGVVSAILALTLACEAAPPPTSPPPREAWAQPEAGRPAPPPHNAPDTGRAPDAGERARPSPPPRRGPEVERSRPSPSATTRGERELPFDDTARRTEINRTLDLIEAGGPFPYAQDGAVFQNRERRLPARDPGYYREYTVRTPRSPDRGARRIVQGRQPTRETWYSDDHYRTFIRIDPRRR
jgi:ribonuclease T1